MEQQVHVLFKTLCSDTIVYSFIQVWDSVFAHQTNSSDVSMQVVELMNHIKMKGHPEHKCITVTEYNK